MEIGIRIRIGTVILQENRKKMENISRR